MEKFWKTKLKEPKACEIEKGFTCIAMQGYRRFEDYYLIIPEKGIFFPQPTLQDMANTNTSFL